MYALAIRSMIYAQICTQLGLAFITEMFDRFQKNPRIEH
jgi:hypothetical protein